MNLLTKRLSEIPNNVECKIFGFESDLDVHSEQSLLSLGFVPGTLVCVEHRAPLGGALAVRLRGGLLALRTNLASKILIGLKD